jgi:hypothetical protein
MELARRCGNSRFEKILSPYRGSQNPSGLRAARPHGEQIGPPASSKPHDDESSEVSEKRNLEKKATSASDSILERPLLGESSSHLDRKGSSIEWCKLKDDL